MVRDTNHDGSEPKRRVVLKSILGGTAAAVAGSGVGGAASGDEGGNDPRFVAVRDRMIEEYTSLERDEQVPIFNDHAASIMSLLSEPAGEVEALRERLPDIYARRDVSLLKSDDVTAFDFEAGYSSMAVEGFEGDPTPSLKAVRRMPDYEIALTVQPEVDRAYAVVDMNFDDPTADDNFVVEERDNELINVSSLCTKGTACDYASIHIEGCASRPGCYPKYLYCCYDTETCYWGSLESRFRCQYEYCTGPSCAERCGF